MTLSSSTWLGDRYYRRSGLREKLWCEEQDLCVSLLRDSARSAPQAGLKPATLRLAANGTPPRLGDPFNPATERQVLLALGVVVAFLVWRFDGRTG